MLDAVPVTGTRSIVFTDMVNSTALRSRLGDVAADEVRRDHDRVLRDAVGRCRGSVVKGTGDGVMAVFEAATDAASCAVAMQQAVHRLGRRRGVELAIRVGVSSGDVAWDGADWSGTPVVEAARLEAAAETSQILASTLVRALAGSRTDLVFEPVGALALKGLAGPLEACSIGWEPSPAAGPLPLPSLLTLARPFAFVGRHDEEETLARAWAAASGGEQRTVLVAGDAGIGKTRLVSELAARAHASGGIVLAGRCDEDLGLPYQPFVEALRRFVDHAPDYLVHDAFAGSAAELTRMVPEVAARVTELREPASSDPETDRYRLFEAVTSWLVTLAAEEPVLVVLEDLHWATKPTLLLLRHLHTSQSAPRLLVVATYRPTDITPEHPLSELLAELHRGPDAGRIDLGGLDDEAVAALMAEALDRPLSEPEMTIAATIREGTGGNAFFAGEVVGHVADAGTEHFSVSMVPDSVREVVGGRLAQLPEGAHEVLVAAATIGPAFEVPLLAAVSVAPDAAVLDALDAASRAHLVEESALDQYRFTHALVREAIHGDQSTSRRIRMHGRVADAIRSRYGDDLDEHIVALAYHYGEVARADPAAAVTALEFAQRAGDRALIRLAPEEASEQFERALDLAASVASEPERHCDLYLGLGTARTRTADLEGARDAYWSAAEIARPLRDGRRMAAAAIGFRGPPRATTDRTRDVVLFDDALDLLDEREPALLALVHAYLARTAATGAASARKHSEEALRLAHDLDDPAVECNALLARCWTTFGSNGAAAQLALADRAADAARASGSQELLLEALASLFLIADHLDEAVAQRALAELSDVADEFRDPYYRAQIPVIEARRLVASGDLEEAERLAGLYLALDSDESTLASYLAQLMVTRGLQGRADELASGMALEFDPADRSALLAVHLAAVLLHVQAGHSREGQESLEQLVADRFSVLTAEGFWARQLELALLADICARLDHARGAEALYPLIAPYAGAHAHAMLGIYFGPLAMHVGMLESVLGRYDDAIGHLEWAQQHLDRTGARALELRARAELGCALVARTAPDRGHELLRSARADAERLGLIDIVRRCDDLELRASP